jgi:hypothetical protein
MKWRDLIAVDSSAIISGLSSAGQAAVPSRID